MAAQKIKTLCNLNYRSICLPKAGSRVITRLPSPQLRPPLTKYFFFPGFSPLPAACCWSATSCATRSFQNDAAPLRLLALHRLGNPAPETVEVSLFGYENTALSGLLDAWAASVNRVLSWCRKAASWRGSAIFRRCLAMCTPIRAAVSRCACCRLWSRNVTMNCCGRAMSISRAAKTLRQGAVGGSHFIWQIYPQHDAVHFKKLEAFLMLYGERLGHPANEALHGMWKAWSLESGAGRWWPAFIAARGELERHARLWAQQLSENNLALNLLDFSREIGRMRALKIEG